MIKRSTDYTGRVEAIQGCLFIVVHGGDGGPPTCFQVAPRILHWLLKPSVWYLDLYCQL